MCNMEFLTYLQRDYNGNDLVKATDLYQQYVDWCGDTATPVSQRKFFLDIKSHIPKIRKRTGKYYNLTTIRAQRERTPESQSSVIAFMRFMRMNHEGDSLVKATDLYQQYVDWCSDTATPVAQRKFFIRIQWFTTKTRRRDGSYYDISTIKLM